MMDNIETPCREALKKAKKQKSSLDSSSREFLDVISHPTGSEKAIFSLLSEKKRNAGTFKLEPSRTLKLVKQFLPEMQLANSRLQQDIQNNPEGGKTKYDIENTEGTQGPLIEMDLALYTESESNVDIFSDSSAFSTESEPDDETKLNTQQEVSKNKNLIHEI